MATFHAHVKAVPVDVKNALIKKSVECVAAVKNACLKNATHMLELSLAQPSLSSSTQIDMAMVMDFLQWHAAQ